MSNSGSLKTDPLFVGLTRPPMFLGVSYKFVMLNGAVSLLYYIQTTDLTIFVILIINHLIGYIICFKEPLFIELFMIKFGKCNVCKNKFYHSADSYDFY